MDTPRTDGILRCVAAVVTGFILAACSGGGGGGEEGVVYTGATTQAAVTGSNGVALTTTAYQGGNSGGSFALVGVASEPVEGVGGTVTRATSVSRVLTDAVRSARFASHASSQMAVGVVESVSGSLDPGNCGGTASFSGTANDQTGEIRATFTFSGWCNDGVTVAGRVTAEGQVDVVAEELIALEFSFVVLTVSDGTDTFRGSGSITVDFGASESMIIDMDFAAGDGTTYRVSDLQMAVTPSASGESLTITGRVYHPVHGYVDVTTPVAFDVQTGDAFPSAGELVATGANDSKARLTALSPTEFQIDVDADGDGTYETNLGTFTWESV